MGFCCTTAAILASTLGLSNISFADTAFVSDKDADLRVECTCIVDDALCQLKTADSILGNQRKTWTQLIHVRPNVPADLNAACYRKRDVTGFGDGLCCTMPNDEASTIKKLFRGEVQ